MLDHQYERSCRVANEVCVDGDLATNGTVYVTAGIGGLTAVAPWLDPKPSWAVVQDTDARGYLRLDVENRTHIKATGVDSLHGDAVFDSFWLVA